MEGIGLALGGGGITGCSHVGVICALEEEGIPISAIGGTSSGGMVAALYAAGYSGDKLKRLVPELSKKLLDYDYSGLLLRFLNRRGLFPGMIRGRRLRTFLESKLGAATIQESRVPLAVITADLVSARQVLFAGGRVNPLYLGEQVEVVREAPTVDAVLGSISIPGLFRPVAFQSYMLVDGGLMDNCPTAALKALGAQRLLAVNLVSVKPVHPPFWTAGAVVTRSLSIGLNRLSQGDASYADLLLNPDLCDVELLDFEAIDLCMEKGYECTRQHMKEIRRLVEEPILAAKPAFPYAVAGEPSHPSLTQIL